MNYGYLILRIINISRRLCIAAIGRFAAVGRLRSPQWCTLSPSRCGMIETRQS